MNVSSLGGYSYAAQGASQRQNMQGSRPSSGNAASGTDAATTFLNYMKETPAQRFQDSWLAQHGISRADFDAMSDAQKQKIIAEMKQDIEQKVKEQMGSSDHKPVDMVV